MVNWDKMDKEQADELAIEVRNANPSFIVEVWTSPAGHSGVSMTGPLEYDDEGAPGDAIIEAFREKFDFESWDEYSAWSEGGDMAGADENFMRQGK